MNQNPLLSVMSTLYNEKKKKRSLTISFVTVDGGLVVAVRLSCFSFLFIYFFCVSAFHHTHNRDTV